MNEKCDDKCQQNADKFLENVTALWMVERIRHRDSSEHRYDLKFTIIPINDNDEIKQQIDHNTLENRLRHQMKKSYVLRDSDYPRYFNNRRTDHLFRTGFTRTLSSLMNPNNMLQTLLSGFNISPLQQASLVHSNVVKSDASNKETIIKDTRLNTGEFYIGMKPKITASLPASTQKLNYHSSPSANLLTAHSNGNLLPQSMLKFPESQEQTSNNNYVRHQLIQQSLLPHYMTQRGQPQPQQQRPKPEIYHHTNSPIDPRGAIDNIHVGSDNKQFHYHKAAAAPPALMTAPLLYTLPIDMNSIIQSLPAAAAYPLSLQFSTPTNPASLWFAQPEVTTFRYPQMVDHQKSPQQQPPLGAAKIPHQKNSGERHTAVYSRPDPVYHASLSALKTEATASQSTRQHNYANANSVRLKSSHQLNKYDDNDDEFKPITPMYDVRRHKNGYRLAPTTPSSTPAAETSTPAWVKATEPTSAQIRTVSAERDESILPTIIVESDEKSNEIAGYRVVSERATMTTTEKPVLKWMPKQRKTKPTNQTFAVTPSSAAPMPTETIFDQIETTTLPPATTQLHHVTKMQQFFRGRNRFTSKRNSTLRVASPTLLPQSSISPASAEPIIATTTTKLIRKKSSTTHAPSSLLSSSTVYPAYVTVTPIPMTDEVTLQSLSTSISYEVSGDASESDDKSDSSQQQTTSMPGYELVPADVVEVMQGNSGNMQMFQVGASEVPDDLTISILNHAKTLEKNDSSSSNSDEDGLKKKV